MFAKGVNGSIDFDGKTLEISKKLGLTNVLVASGIRGDKSIPIDQVVSLLFQPAKTMSQGFIQIGQVGVTPPRNGIEMLSDANTVHFEKRHQEDFENLRSAIQKAIDQNKTSQISTAGSSIADELGKLKHLLDIGAIDEEEFADLKRKLING